MIDCPDCTRLKESAIKRCPKVEIIIHGHVQYKNETTTFVVYENIGENDKTKNIQDRLDTIFHDVAVQTRLSLEKK